MLHTLGGQKLDRGKKAAPGATFPWHPCPSHVGNTHYLQRHGQVPGGPGADPAGAEPVLLCPSLPGVKEQKAEPQQCRSQRLPDSHSRVFTSCLEPPQYSPVFFLIHPKIENPSLHTSCCELQEGHATGKKLNYNLLQNSLRICSKGHSKAISSVFTASLRFLNTNANRGSGLHLSPRPCSGARPKGEALCPHSAASPRMDEVKGDSWAHAFSRKLHSCE